MDPELKKLLEEERVLLKDNHRMLKAVRRSQLFDTFTKVVIWGVVIFSTIYSYQHYIAPLITKFSSVKESATSSDVFTATFAEIQKLLNLGNTNK